MIDKTKNSFAALAMVSSLDWFANRVISRRPLRFEHIKKTEKILSKLIYFSDRFFNPSEVRLITYCEQT